jgi:hypothetical protein
MRAVVAEIYKMEYGPSKLACGLDLPSETFLNENETGFCLREMYGGSSDRSEGDQ